MKKIPTLFERDWEGDRSRVVDVVNPAAQWVADGEGVATRKYDGTACAIIGGVLYKRHALTVPNGSGQSVMSVVDPEGATVAVPDGFVLVDIEASPGRKGPVTKAIGWLPVGDGPEDQWAREAFEFIRPDRRRDGTYELIGPKIQGNPEGVADHILGRHDTAAEYLDAPRDFAGLRAWLDGRDIEGLVWHHPDGRMAKIKLRDFGLIRSPS